MTTGWKRWICLAWLLLIPITGNAVTPQVAAGQRHTVALKNNGTLVAVGDDSAGQLGLGRLLQSSTPLQVKGLGQVRAFAAGAAYTVALKQDGTFWAWAQNGSGQLGDGTYVQRLTPVVVVNETVDGFLDLVLEILNNIPASAVPPIILEARKLDGLVSLTLGANVYFGVIDLGALAAGTFSASGAYKVCVAAIVPENIAGVAAGIYLLDSNRNWSFYSSGPLPEYVSNATLDQTQHYFVWILEGVNLTGLIGTRILVGYGTDDQEMLAAQRYREIYVVQPDPTR